MNNQNDAAVKAAERIVRQTGLGDTMAFAAKQHEVSTIIQSAIDTALSAERAENERLREANQELRQALAEFSLSGWSWDGTSWRSGEVVVSGAALSLASKAATEA
jgi:hypothetical protein